MFWLKYICYREYQGNIVQITKNHSNPTTVCVTSNIFHIFKMYSRFSLSMQSVSELQSRELNDRIKCTVFFILY